MAYRKVKVDLFYSSRACRSELRDFEARLERNLGRIQRRLRRGVAPEVTGHPWTLMPKSIGPEGSSKRSFLSSDPSDRWVAMCEAGKPRAEFRLMEALSIEFHVFATLWIQRVGHKFDGQLSDAVCGNRLRRTAEQDLNPLSLGSITPYIHSYCKWRDDGIGAIREALDRGESVIAVTADASSFFHRLDPSFMLDSGFLESIGVELSDRESALHELFIEALLDWAQKTPLKRGLPVGLVASSVIANVSLFDFDQFVHREVVPLHYGRYVDDVMLVMENCMGFSGSADVWDWLCRRSGGALAKTKNKKGAGACEAGIRFTRPYLKGSCIEFANSKNKAFALSGLAGRALLSTIERQVQARTSEWRSLPELPEERAQIEANLLAAIQADGEGAESLSRADRISVRRGSLALYIRDMEAYNRALPPEAWCTKRHSFLDAFVRHVLVLPSLFDFFAYLSRVIEIATSCADFEYLLRIVDALNQVLEDLAACEVAIHGSVTPSKALAKRGFRVRFREEVKIRIAQAIESSIPLRLSPIQRRAWREFCGRAGDLLSERDLEVLRESHRRLFSRDLAHRPLKQLLLPKAFVGGVRRPVAKKSLVRIRRDIARKLVDGKIVDGVSTLSGMSRIPGTPGLTTGLLFPTRPPSIQDLYVIHRRPYSRAGAEDIAACLLALRGFFPKGTLPVQGKVEEGAVIHVPFSARAGRNLRIAVASWGTAPRSWVASVNQSSDPDSTRLDRLLRLLNTVLGSRRKPDYLVLPELSLPPHWFLAVAGKLLSKGISLICGVDYIHVNGDVVRNQAWAALCLDALGFPAWIIYRQDKQRPAQREEADLWRIGGRVLVPELHWDIPPIIDHGGFHFAVLICSELTNIGYRAALRGSVDALFVPEWNQDTESFNVLVESAASDIHGYVIQCNDRQYGDSRIRAPRKNAWERDVVRVKGGVEDYFVVGEIDVDALRAFQSNFRSPGGPFKPVPDGFEMSPRRRTLPKP